MFYNFYHFLKIFLKIFLVFLREVDRQNTSRGGAEREEDTEYETAPGSELSAQSPTQGLNSQTARS